ncbi:MAG: hypothetical protein PHD76_06905 [Methylacidiphilales bacterium]|nr:hypothetical protein [Candidatus Methylacidiphilales bacterium]
MEKELRARGEPLTLDEILPASIPDDENVAAAPIFKELWADEKKARLSQLKLPNPSEGRPPILGDSMTGARVDLVGWQKLLTGKNDPKTAGADILATLSKYDPILQDLDQALQRPKVLWPMNRDRPFETRIPYLNSTVATSQLLILKSDAALSVGKSDLALLNLKRIYRLNRAVDNGVLISHLVALIGNNISLLVVQEGITTHCWSEMQLVEIQGMLLSEDFLFSYKEAHRLERASFNRMILIVDSNIIYLLTALGTNETNHTDSKYADFCLKILPKGWRDQDRAFFNQTIQTYYLDPVDPKLQRVDSLKIQPGEVYISNEFRFWPRLLGYRLLSSLALPSLNGVIRKTAQIQTQINLAAVACGLERYRLAHGKLPDSLQALVPNYIPQLPHDLITGAALHYNRVSDQDYILYSTGWDGKDDGGVFYKKHKEQGDWVWASRPDLYKIKE